MKTPTSFRLTRTVMSLSIIVLVAGATPVPAQKGGTTQRPPVTVTSPNDGDIRARSASIDRMRSEAAKDASNRDPKLAILAKINADFDRLKIIGGIIKEANSDNKELDYKNIA